MLRLLFIAALSLLPCILWLWYFYTRSVWKRDPLRVVGLTFVLGGLATLIAIRLNLWGQSLITALPVSYQAARLLVILLVIAPVEELCKLLAVYVYAWRHEEFDEPLDGVIYSAAAALGFAAVENVIYLSQNDPSLVLLRGPLSNPGHALFSALWGLSLSRAKTAPNLPQKRLTIIAAGWLIAVLLHTLFDVLLEAVEYVGPLMWPLIVGAMIALFLWVRARIHFHRDRSPHREGTMLLQFSADCLHCGRPGLAETDCPKCGTFIPRRDITGDLSANAAPTTIHQESNDDSQPRLVRRSGKGEETVAWLLNEKEITIGRTLNNDLVIEDPSVSRRHARIEAVNGSFKVSDLNSSNGTFLNGKRVTEATLQEGCEIRFGNVRYVFRSVGL